MNLYEEMKKYSVPADGPEDFLKRYTRPGRGIERGEDYQAARVEAAHELLNKFGYCTLSRHDSISGDIVTWYPTEK